MINKERKIKNGFTLIEMIVSVAIISIAILGIFSIITNYSQKTQQEKENIIATYLCQEGIEIVKNIRDTNWVESAASWKDGLTTCGSGCEADFTNNSLSAWSDSGRYLYIENSTNLYKYIGTPYTDVKTQFKRKITITPVGDDELDIQVDVYWFDNTATVKENIYNWKP